MLITIISISLKEKYCINPYIKLQRANNNLRKMNRIKVIINNIIHSINVGYITDGLFQIHTVESGKVRKNGKFTT